MSDKNIDNLFFELIQVSLGLRLSLSATPSTQDWQALYRMSHKQAILGVCFNGVHIICTNHPEQASGLPLDLRMRWIGSAAEIQKQNELMNHRCVDLCERLQDDGLSCCVLKGQGISALYGHTLANLRQCGDIDVWVKDADIQMLSDYMRSQGVDYNATIAHVEGDLMKDVSVELHATPAYFKNFRYNKRLQSWCSSYDWNCCKSINGFSVPSDSFNLVFLLVHLYHHFLYEGVGFRQLMDYYQFLMSIDSTNRQALYKEATIFLQSFGMWRFTQGVMYLMKVVFCMRSEFLICEPDAKTGQLLLTDMLESGNMGKYHSNKRHNRSNRLIWHWTNFKRNLGFVSIAPAEILAAPFWSLWHWCWRKHNGIL